MKNTKNHRFKIGIFVFTIASISIYSNASETKTYTYDALGRLVSAATMIGPSQTYEYDAVGNRKNYSTSGSIPTIYVDNATLTQGKLTCSGSNCYVQIFGLSTGGIGSVSPATLSGGKILKTFYDQKNGYGQYIVSELSVSGFTADPGKSWLDAAKALGQTRTGAAAITYGYSGGTAKWTWSTAAFGFTGTGAVTITITHK